MTISEARANEMLEARNRAFMTADIKVYMELWDESGTIEMGAFQFVGGEKIRQAIVGAWAVSRVLHMETRSFAIRGKLLLNEFAIVWQNKQTGEISLQTGMGVLEVNDAGLFCCLRDYMEASTGMRKSAVELPAIAKILGSGR